MESTNTSSIEVTTRSDLSLLYKVLRTIIRPLRPRLVKPGKPAPSESQKLSPPEKRGCKVIESRREGIWEYTFRHSSQPASQGGQPLHDGVARVVEERKPASKKHRVYYFCGGGFQSPPSNEHWRFITQVTKDLAQSQGQHREVEITVVSHPLAPASPAAEALPVLRKWLASALVEANLAGDTVTLMGDSSGGNIALSLGFWAVENYKAPSASATSGDGNGLPLVAVFVISPAVDLRNVNPGIEEVDRYDPVLTVGLTSQVARAWTGNVESKGPVPGKPAAMEMSNPTVSPLLQPEEMFRLMRDRGVSVHGVVGTHDVLAPDALEFMRKCERFGVRGKWLVWDGQMHCFPLAGGGEIVGLREGKEGRRWVDEVLREDARV
ncbi:Alpha/Beta hydrolase protein [Exophiala viscosa]|uniref:Alpha/Beta hydrolase protein n=1 Tax=Exophiala viscosa TaxID=2486360 RepID=UPI00218F2897|nr:Alpha/Beta hydrolase protein [Exophiala viscosa]